MPRGKADRRDFKKRHTGSAIRGTNMGRGPHSVEHLKPPKFKDYMTMGEVVIHLQVDSSWLKRLEKADRIPKAMRVRHGALEYRLWSPEQVEEIRQILRGHQVGRPKTT